MTEFISGSIREPGESGYTIKDREDLLNAGNRHEDSPKEKEIRQKLSKANADFRERFNTLFDLGEEKDEVERIGVEESTLSLLQARERSLIAEEVLIGLKMRQKTRPISFKKCDELLKTTKRGLASTQRAIDTIEVGKEDKTNFAYFMEGMLRRASKNRANEEKIDEVFEWADELAEGIVLFDREQNLADQMKKIYGVDPVGSRQHTNNIEMQDSFTKKDIEQLILLQIETSKMYKRKGGDGSYQHRMYSRLTDFNRALDVVRGKRKNPESLLKVFTEFKERANNLYSKMAEKKYSGIPESEFSEKITTRISEVDSFVKENAKDWARKGDEDVKNIGKSI